MHDFLSGCLIEKPILSIKWDMKESWLKKKKKSGEKDQMIYPYIL